MENIVNVIESSLTNLDLTLVEVKTKMDEELASLKAETDGEEVPLPVLAAHYLQVFVEWDKIMSCGDEDNVSEAFYEEPELVARIIAKHIKDETAKFYFVGRMKDLTDSILVWMANHCRR